MNHPIHRRGLLAQGAALSAGLCLAPWARAQAGWPNKPIRFIVPYNAGGATDVSARVIADKLGQRLGQTLIVENKGGAAGIVGTDMVAKAAPDGSTFVFTLSASVLTNQFLFNKLPYDPQKDLALVSQIAVVPVALVVHPDVPARNAAELQAWISKNKGKVSYGSWGIGSYAHLAGAYMSQALNADMSHVAYKGEAPMLQDLLGGQIQMAYASASATKPHIESGKLKVIGVTGDQRMATLPNVPTLMEQGLKDDAYRICGFVAMAAPAKTPMDILQRMAKEVNAVVQMPETREKLVAMGFNPVASTPEAFMASYKKDAPVWEQLVKVSGAKLD